MSNRLYTGRMPAGLCLLAIAGLVSCSSRGGATDEGRAAEATTATALLSRFHLSAGAAAQARALRPSGDGFALAAVEPTGRRWRPIGGELVAKLPSRANRATRLSLSGHPDVWLEITPADLRDAPATVEPRALVFRDAALDLDVVDVALEGAVEEFRILRSVRAATTARWTIQHGPGIQQVRLREGIVEALDVTGVVRFASERMVAADAAGRDVPLTTSLGSSDDARALVVVADTRDASFPVMVDPKWTSLAAVPIAMEYTKFAPLGGDRYLMVGGRNTTTSIPTDGAAIYDLTTDKWTVVGSLNVGRFRHEVAPLAGGSALVIGGQDAVGDKLSSVERFNTTTMAFDLVKPMAGARTNGTASLTLTSGKVLMIGGQGAAGAYSTGEIYDPDADTWVTTAPAPVEFGYAALFQESADVVLAAGGYATTFGNTWGKQTHRLSLASKTWTVGPTMVTATQQFAGLMKAGSKIMVVSPYASATQLLDPATDQWSVLPDHALYPGAVLGDGTLLLPGNAMYLYNPVSETFKTTTASGLPTGAAERPCMFPASGNRAVNFCSQPPQVFTNVLAGGSCGSDADCSSGFCTDGVCCDKRCDSTCQACAEAGSVGTCKTVTGAPRAPRSACAGTGVCAGSCNGVAVICTAAPPPSTECAPASCAAGSFTTASFCDGSGACVASTTTTPCGAYACSTTGCKTSCSADADCAAGKVCSGTTCGDAPPDAGPEAAADTDIVDTALEDTAVADTAVADPPVAADTAIVDTEPPFVAPDAAATPIVKGDYYSCTSASECSSGFCVDGVCCDRACGGTCESCALPTSPGRCALVAVGTDPRAQCSAGGDCLSTCDGTGKCRTAFAGSQCAPNRCTGPNTGIGAAFCIAQGAACPTAAATVFNCGAYACDPAFGACTAFCRGSDDCAPGNQCASGVCMAAPPAEDDAGCSLPRAGSRSARGAGTFVLSALAVATALRRRRLRAD